MGKAFELFLNGLTAHLKKEYGLDADHLILYCCDEPHAMLSSRVPDGSGV